MRLVAQKSSPSTAFPDSDPSHSSTSRLDSHSRSSSIHRDHNSATTRLQTKHRRSQTEGQDHRNTSIGKLSKLFDTVLGFPFPSSAQHVTQYPERDRAAMTEHTGTEVTSITRIATNEHTEPAATTHRSSHRTSPNPSVDYTLVSVPNTPLRYPTAAKRPDHSSTLTLDTSPNFVSTLTLNNSTNPAKPSGKRILPRLWTALSSPTKEATIRFKRKGKGKAALGSEPFDDYPLDGEEGELVDDEACFVGLPSTVDILANLPPEIALHVLLFLDFKAIFPCLSVSRTWRRLASDPLIWRTLFYAAGWEIHNDLALHRLAAVRQPTTSARAARNSSFVSVAASFRNEVDIALSRVRRVQPSTSQHSHSQSQLSLSTSPSGPNGVTHRHSFCSTSTSTDTQMPLFSSSSLLGTSISIPDGALAPLALDWQTLYKTRHQLDRRMCGLLLTSVPHVAPPDVLTPVGSEPRVMKLTGHLDSVYCLEFDAHKIVTGSRDKTIKLWSLRTGKLRATLRGHEGSVLCLKFDNTGFMVSGSSDRRILVWQLAKGGVGGTGAGGEVRKVLTGHQGGVLDIRVDKQWIVSCSKDALIRVWDRATLDAHCTLYGHDGPVNAVGLQNGKIVSASGDGRMMMWDIMTATRIRTFEGHDFGLACIEFKEDYIVSGSNDHKIKVWSVTTGECLTTLSGHTALVRALSFNSRTGRLVSGSYDKTVKVWDIHSGRMLREFKNAHESHIFDVKFDAARIVSTSHDQKIVVLDWSYGLDVSLFV